jgi:Spy/CpxP family protein refolding chaperone
MMKKVLVYAVALFLAAGIAVHADAAMQGKKKSRGMGPERSPEQGMMGCCMDDGHPMMAKLMSLGLDDRQKESIRSIHMNMKKEHIRGRAGVDVAEIELKEILMKDPVDLKAAEAKLRQIEALKTDLHLGHIKTHEEVKAVLTPEQRKNFNDMMMEMGGCMGCGMGMMHGHDGTGMKHGRGMKHGCNMMGGTDTPPPADKKESPAPPSAGHQH